MLCYVMFDIGLIVNRSVENNTKSVTFAINLFHVTNVEPIKPVCQSHAAL